MFTDEIQRIGDALGLQGKFLVDYGFDHIIEEILCEHTHPLDTFFNEVKSEYDRGLAKYGEWHMLTAQEQIAAVKSECLEW
jgi:hypothetical protein